MKITYEIEEISEKKISSSPCYAGCYEHCACGPEN